MGISSFHFRRVPVLAGFPITDVAHQVGHLRLKFCLFCSQRLVLVPVFVQPLAGVLTELDVEIQ